MAKRTALMVQLVFERMCKEELVSRAGRASQIVMETVAKMLAR
jgi:hypothetical protein